MTDTTPASEWEQNPDDVVKSRSTRIDFKGTDLQTAQAAMALDSLLGQAKSELEKLIPGVEISWEVLG